MYGYERFQIKSGARTVIFFENIYRTRAIITSGLYTFYPIFEGQKRFLRSFFRKILTLFKSGFKSRAGYSGACTVY